MLGVEESKSSCEDKIAEKRFEDFGSVPNALEWSVADVLLWASNSKYSPSTINSLAQNQISGEMLLTLSPKDLREEIGIKALSERRRFALDIDVLKGFMRVHENLASVEFQEIKEVVTTLHDKLGYEDPLMCAVSLQLSEITLEESRMRDHFVASDLQGYFNKLYLLDEKDEAIAKAVGNTTDASASERLRVQSEAETQRENASY